MKVPPMTPELPAIQGGMTPMLERDIGCGSLHRRRMTESDLAALLAALPNDQLEAVVGPFFDKLAVDAIGRLRSQLQDSRRMLEGERAKPCIAPITHREGEALTVLWLRDGTKVLAQHSKTGAPFLLVEPAHDIRPAAPAPQEPDDVPR